MRLRLNLALGLISVIGIWSGCSMRPWSSIPFTPPNDVANIRLEKRDSAVIEVDKMWLERKNGELVIRGYVMAQERGADTRKARLVISLRDTSGRELRATTLGFAPQQIPRGYKLPGTSAFVCKLDPLPEATALIVVSPVDAPP